MSNSNENELANLVTICPYCNSRIVLQFQIVDLFIYTNFDGTLHTVTLKKTFSKKSENEQYIKTFILNSLKRKPFISRVIITKPYYDVINELIKKEFLTNKDLENISNNF